ALIVSALLIAAIWFTGRLGFSRLLTQYGARATQGGLLEALDEAVALTPSDAEAHYVRGAILANRGELGEAIKEYEKAAALRPSDYYMWQALGILRDRAEDEEGAIADLNEAVRLAPSYARPRFLLGNLFFRAGRRDEAFEQLRRAVKSDESLLPNVIDLAWGASGGDAEAVKRAIQPHTQTEHLALAHYFARRGKSSEVLEMIGAAGHVPKKDQQTLLDELLAAKNYSTAYAIWKYGREGKLENSEQALGRITDGGFENINTLDEQGFGWQQRREMQAVHISLDKDSPREGAYSLRVDWSGDSNPAAGVLNQLVLVEPQTRYHLRFAARTQDIVTGGLPLLVVTDTSSKEEKVLGQSQPLPQGKSDWQEYSVDFATQEGSRAVRLNLQRGNCSDAPCPIFGHVWLDAVALQKAS
ncbi:MAG: tetratricopeptide repeat protein, partial [Pyrinomonadaceae bacterium]